MKHALSFLVPMLCVGTPCRDAKAEPIIAQRVTLTQVRKAAKHALRRKAS